MQDYVFGNFLADKVAARVCEGLYPSSFFRRDVCVLPNINFAWRALAETVFWSCKEPRACLVCMRLRASMLRQKTIEIEDDHVFGVNVKTDDANVVSPKSLKPKTLNLGYCPLPVTVFV